MQKSSPHGGITVFAIIVTYNPDMSLLRRSAGSLVPQVSRLYIIDNGSARADAIASEFGGGNVSVVTLGGNMGIAAATNAGLRMAIAGGADWVITSDQDTEYPPDYVESFSRLLSECPVPAAGVAAFVPVFHDELRNRTAPVYVRGRLIERRTVPSGPYTVVSRAIASGMIISAACLGIVGPMRDDLFIDMVDTEWCWRAHARGKAVVCCRDLRISHRLGDGLSAAGPVRVALRSPVRHYYMARNGIYLALRTRCLPSAGRILLLVESLRFVLIYPLLCRGSRLQNLRHTLRGMLDALRGRMGSFGAGGG